MKRGLDYNGPGLSQQIFLKALQGRGPGGVHWGGPLPPQPDFAWRALVVLGVPVRALRFILALSKSETLQALRFYMLKTSALSETHFWFRRY